MSDDIVTMLRREYGHFNNDGIGDYELLTIAADEIERLREAHILIEVLMDERNQWRSLAERFYKVSYCDPDCKGVLDEEAECSCDRFNISCDYEGLIKIYPAPTPPSYNEVYRRESTLILGE